MFGPALTIIDGDLPFPYELGLKTNYNTIDANCNAGEIVSVTTVSPEYLIKFTKTSEFDSQNRLNRQVVVNVPSSVSNYLMTPQYDGNGNTTEESFNGYKMPESFEYGLDQQLIVSSTESHRNFFDTFYDCFNRTYRTFAYELGGRPLRSDTSIYDCTNSHDVWTRYYSDYFYYSHDGVVAEQYQDINVLKFFTRLGRELFSAIGGGIDYYYIQNYRGDVILLVNANDTVTSIRDYDANGGVICKAPDEREDRDPFGFIGGIDCGNGFWKLGARFYDSNKSSFIQQDRYMGDPKR